jgi:phage terminase large subunit
VQKSIKDSVKQLLEDKIKEHGLSDRFLITREEIRGPNDSLVVFKGLQTMNAVDIKSMEGFNRAWYEEAQALSVGSVDTAVPTFRKDSEQWFSWNPCSPKDAVEKHFNGNEGDPDFVSVEANYHDNPWFPDELRRDMRRDRVRDPDKYAHVWLGKYAKRSQAQVFHNWKIEEFEIPRGTQRFYYGADWGYANDPTVLVCCFIVGNKLYVHQEAWAVGCEIDHTPRLFDTVTGARKWSITADSSRPETISFMKRQGFNIKPALKGTGSVEDGIEFLKSYDIIVHPRCTKTIEEMYDYSWKIDDHTQEVLPVLEDKNNHVIDALRYAVEGIRRGGTKIPEGAMSWAAESQSRYMRKY